MEQAANQGGFAGNLFKSLLQAYRDACSFVRVDEVSVSNNGRAAVARFMTWSRNCEFELVADAVLVPPASSGAQSQDVKRYNQREELSEHPPNQSSDDGVIAFTGSQSIGKSLIVTIVRSKGKQSDQSVALAATFR